MDRERVMHAPLALGIGIDRRLALGEDQVVLAGGQEDQLVHRREIHKVQSEHLGIELLARVEVAHGDAGMHHAAGLDLRHRHTRLSADRF